MVSSASICSVTRIVPSSVATALPTRATSTMQVNTGASSRASDSSTVAPTRDCALKRPNA